MHHVFGTDRMVRGQTDAIHDFASRGYTSNGVELSVTVCARTLMPCMHGPSQSNPVLDVRDVVLLIIIVHTHTHTP